MYTFAQDGRRADELISGLSEVPLEDSQIKAIAAKSVSKRCNHNTDEGTKDFYRQICLRLMPGGTSCFCVVTPSGR